MAQTRIFDIQETLRLNKRGVWLSNGEEILHQPTVRAFTRHLTRASEKPLNYAIQIGNEKKTVEIEDTPYFVEGISSEEQGPIQIRIKNLKIFELNIQTLRLDEPGLVCEIEIRGQQERARFLPSAYHQIMKNLEEDEKSYFLRTRDKRGTEIRTDLLIK